MKIYLSLFLSIIPLLLIGNLIIIPQDYATIQQGIDASVDGDTVLVQPGIFVENINYNAKNITVASLFLTTADTTYISQTIIDGNENGSVVIFQSGEDTTSVLTGFTLTGGSGSVDPLFGNLGGGIYCSGSSPKIISNIVTINYANQSAGAHFSNSSAIILNNVISFNNANLNIGGIAIHESDNANIKGNFIFNNTAGYTVGGALIQSCSPIFENNVICQNTATYCGGLDVYNTPETDRAIISNCYIYGNSSEISRGGLLICDANLDVVNCTIHDNNADLHDGGIGVYEDSNVNLMCTSIYNNTAGGYGGGIGIGADLTIVNCTIVNNVAITGGNQIDCYSGEIEAVNTIIGGNSSNGSIYFNIDSPVFRFCDFYNSQGPNFTGPFIPPSMGEIVTENLNGDPCDEFMNILLDPLFIDLNNNNFHLTEFSPCIDAGFPASPTDPDGSICDIGRYCFDPANVDDSIINPKITLYQNYPNPFNPTTTIYFELTTEYTESTELIIYNIKGQKIKDLTNSPTHQPNNYYEVTWNGTDDNNHPVPSGIYLYKLKTGKEEQTRKMLLLK